MSSTKTDPTIVLDAGTSEVRVVAFYPDGKHVLGGDKAGIRRWRLEDGQEVGKQTGMKLTAISVSRDHKWVVCGTDRGAYVWDAKMQKKVIHVERRNTVNAVDVSPDSSAFATGTEEALSIWQITNGERLVGPLQHDLYITGIRFSPNGEHIVTSSYGGPIRVFDGRSGDELITIETITPSMVPSTPLAWSNDGRQIFAASKDKIKLFDVSTGSQLAESQTLVVGDDVDSIALAANGKFIATFASRTISFLDTSTLSRIDTVIEDSQHIWTIAISLDNGYLATGRGDGKITIRDLGSILPDSYGPFHASDREERQPDEQPPTSGDRDNKAFNSSPEEPGKTSLAKSETHGEDHDDDLLEVEVSPSAPAPEFNFDEPPSPGSAVHCEDEVPPVDASQAIPQLSDAPPLARAEEHVDVVESSRGITKLKQWVQMRTMKSNKDPTSHELDRVPRESRRPADGRSPPRVDATNERPSWMAAGQRVPRAVAKPVVKADPKLPAKDARPKHQSKKATPSGRGPAKPKDGGPQANDESRPSGGGVHLTRESGRATVKGNFRFSISFPGWMCCGSGTGDSGTHSSA